MEDNDYYFNDGMLLRISDGIAGVLKKDAAYFYYIKNGSANINGFLNILLPILADFREEMHELFLFYNEGDEALCRKIEYNIYDIYLSTFMVDEDSYVNLSLRFTKTNYKKFRIMHDKHTQQYNMNFTNYLRSLLSEYAVKRFYQRVLIFMRDTVNIIKRAIVGYSFCEIYAEHLLDEPNGKKKFRFVPIALTINPNTEELFVAGADENLQYYNVPLVCVTDIIVSNTSIDFSEEAYENIKAFIDECYIIELDDGKEEE